MENVPLAFCSSVCKFQDRSKLQDIKKHLPETQVWTAAAREMLTNRVELSVSFGYANGGWSIIIDELKRIDRRRLQIAVIGFTNSSTDKTAKSLDDILEIMNFTYRFLCQSVFWVGLGIAEFPEEALSRMLTFYQRAEFSKIRIFQKHRLVVNCLIGQLQSSGSLHQLWIRLGDEEHSEHLLVALEDFALSKNFAFLSIIQQSLTFDKAFFERFFERTVEPNSSCYIHVLLSCSLADLKEFKRELQIDLPRCVTGESVSKRKRIVWRLDGGAQVIADHCGVVCKGVNSWNIIIQRSHNAMSTLLALDITYAICNMMAVICISTFSVIFICSQILPLTLRILVLNTTIWLLGRAVCGFTRAILHSYEVTSSMPRSSEGYFEVVDNSLYLAVMVSFVVMVFERIVLMSGHKCLLRSKIAALVLVLTTITPLAYSLYLKYTGNDCAYTRNHAILYTMVAMSVLTTVLLFMFAAKKRELTKLCGRQVSLRYECANSIKNTQSILAVTLLLLLLLGIRQLCCFLSLPFYGIENALFGVYTILFPFVFTYKCTSVLKHFPSARKWVAAKSKVKLHPAYRYDSGVWAVGIPLHHYGTKPTVSGS